MAFARARNRELPEECYGECIVEQGINFSGEVSLAGARGHDGRTGYFILRPITCIRRDLRTSVAYPQANAEQQAQAEEMLSAIMHELLCGRDGDGVFCNAVWSG